MSSIERKIMNTSCNEVNSSDHNPSTPAAEEKQRPNPILVQKALVNKSNQKIYDMADILGD